MSQNPFTTRFGILPQVLLDRDELIDDLIEELKDSYSDAQATLITGLRGSGKTVLMEAVKSELEKEGWLSIRLINSDNIFEQFENLLYDKLQGGVKQLAQSITSATVGSLAVEVTPKKQSTIIRINHLLTLAKKQQKSVVILIDEVSNSKAMTEFASAYQIWSGEYPVSLVMTGLPHHIDAIQTNEILTFLLRANRINLGKLSEFSVRDAYANVFTKTDAWLINKMTVLTKAYPYAFQLLGRLVWKACKESVTEEELERCLIRYKDLLYQNVYFEIYKECSRQDREFLKALANGARETKEIASYLGRNANYVTTYRQRLMRKEIVELVQRNQTQLSLPFFDEFIIEANQEYSLYHI